MQKLDFTENIKAIRQLLKSDDIIGFVEKLPLNQAINTHPLTPLVIESKSNYDKIGATDPKMEILESLGAPSIYAQESIGALINAAVHVTLQSQQKINLFLQSSILNFYLLHYSIIKISQISDTVLFENNIDELTSEDTIVFRILIDDGLEMSKYSKILTLLNELIDIVQQVSETEQIQPKITLLDSGSDTNLGIKTTVETAKSLFQIFKEVWDWMLNRKFYKSKLRNSGLLDNLNVMVAIKEAQDKGAIDENTAKIYRETIIRRTEDLLDMKVIPKDLIEVKNESDTKKLLAEFSEVKLLETGEKKE